MFKKGKISTYIFVALLFAAKVITAQQPAETNGNTNQNIQRLTLELIQGLDTEEEKARAIYTWVAQYLEYDYLGVENVTLGFESTDVVQEALSKRKGVCQHYAELFDALARESGLTSLVVFGYTRQNGKIDKVPHAWNAVMIDSVWYLSDPTWASGYFNGTTYVNDFRDIYFMVPPSEMIKSHIPFDPIFQFLKHPVSHDNFKNGHFKPGDISIDYKAEINRYFTSKEEEKIAGAMERVKDFGIANTMVRGYYSNLNRQYKVFYANRQIDLHNEAIEKFNSLVAAYNNYAERMNARGGRIPENPAPLENELIEMEKRAIEIQEMFRKIDAPAGLAHTLAKNQDNLENLLAQIKREINRLKKARI
jgi:hypothetical protein